LLPSIRQCADKDEAYTIIFDYSSEEFKNLCEHDFAEALIIPLRNLESLLGVFILLRHKQDHPWLAKVMEEVNFIGGHTALAWHNATLYANAKEMAFQDAMTGLYNARYLPIAIDREIAHSKESGVPFAVLFLDLDYFKLVNDHHGHQIGSQLLKEVGRVLRRCIRDDDVVVRYGGDEFIVVLKATNLPTAEQIAERIRTMLAGHPFLGREGLSVLITACIGVSVYPVHAQSSEELIFLADHAMYKGKNATRNMVITADPNDLIGRTLPQP
jgi:diguanylate cyclase (GGDEF)-like protein